MQTIKIKLTRSQGKKIFLNDTAIRKKELLGLFRTVLFTPDELQLIKGAPQLRRRFLDMEISQVSPRYYEEFLRCTRAVQQRNSALKTPSSPAGNRTWTYGTCRSLPPPPTWSGKDWKP